MKRIGLALTVAVSFAYLQAGSIPPALSQDSFNGSNVAMLQEACRTDESAHACALAGMATLQLEGASVTALEYLGSACRRGVSGACRVIGWRLNEEPDEFTSLGIQIEENGTVSLRQSSHFHYLARACYHGDQEQCELLQTRTRAFISGFTNIMADRNPNFSRADVEQFVLRDNFRQFAPFRSQGRPGLIAMGMSPSDEDWSGPNTRIARFDQFFSLDYADPPVFWVEFSDALREDAPNFSPIDLPYYADDYVIMYVFLPSHQGDTRLRLGGAEHSIQRSTVRSLAVNLAQQAEKPVILAYVPVYYSSEPQSTHTADYLAIINNDPIRDYDVALDQDLSLELRGDLPRIVIQDRIGDAFYPTTIVDYSPTPDRYRSDNESARFVRRAFSQYYRALRE